MKTWAKGGAAVYVSLMLVQMLFLQGFVSTEDAMLRLPLAAVFGAVLGVIVWAVWTTISYWARALWRLVKGK